MAASAPRPAAIRRRLRKLFDRNGCARFQNSQRLKKEGRNYKKGEEVRFLLFTWSEVLEIRRLLKAAGFDPGAPFRKHRTQWCQPVYGKQQTARLAGLLFRGSSHMPTKRPQEGQS